LIAAGAVTTTVFGFAETISYAIASNGLHRPAAFVGVLAAVQGAGAVTGGLTAAPLVRRLGEGRLIGIAMLVAAAGAALEIPPLLSPVLAGSIVFGAAIPWLVVALITLAQRVTPPELQGRVYAATETLITTPQTNPHRPRRRPDHRDRLPDPAAHHGQHHRPRCHLPPHPS
jgi:hypothetical protein